MDYDKNPFRDIYIEMPSIKHREINSELFLQLLFESIFFRCVLTVSKDI